MSELVLEIGKSSLITLSGLFSHKH